MLSTKLKIMKKEFKITASLLFFAQVVFFICSISVFVYWWVFSGWLNLLVSIFLMYMSINFYGLKIHLGKTISEDLSKKAKDISENWNGLNRRSRRKIGPKLIKRLNEKN